MEHRHLGRSGMLVSAISYGNWLTHGSQIDEAAAQACARTALEGGVTTFDTADTYATGAAEEVLGRALAGVPRHSLELCTKVFFPVGEGVNDRGLSRKHIMEGCHASLRRLGTDYIDVYQAHRYDFATPLEETLRAFDDLVRQGKVLYVGVSEWTAGQIADALRIADEMGFDRIVSNQAQYSLLWRVIEPEVVPICEREGLSQLVFSPLAQGVLTGKYQPGQPVPDGSRATDAEGSEFIGWLLGDATLEPVQRFAEIARETGHTPASVALAWVLRNRNVASAIIGASRPEQVTQNLAALEVTLDDATWAAIDKAIEPTVLRDPGFTTSPEERP